MLASSALETGVQDRTESCVVAGQPRLGDRLAQHVEFIAHRILGRGWPAHLVVAGQLGLGYGRTVLGGIRQLLNCDSWLASPALDTGLQSLAEYNHCSSLIQGRLVWLCRQVHQGC